MGGRVVPRSSVGGVGVGGGPGPRGDRYVRPSSTGRKRVKETEVWTEGGMSRTTGDGASEDREEQRVVDGYRRRTEQPYLKAP